MPATSPFSAVVAALSITALSTGQVMAAPPENSGEIAPDGDPTDEATSYGDAAIQAFQEGRYEEAVQNFEKAFELDGNPNNLFNIGRVYEEAGELESAVDYYKRFISQPGVSLDNRKIALERIDVLEQIIAKTKPAEPEPQEPPPPVIEPDPVTQVDSTAQAEQERRRKQRIAGYVLLGIGGAGLIAGGVTGGLAMGVEGDLADSSDLAERTELVSKGDTMALSADVLYVAGGTLALAGLIVTLTALPKRNERQTAFAPVFDKHGGGVVVMHRF